MDVGRPAPADTRCAGHDGAGRQSAIASCGDTATCDVAALALRTALGSLRTGCDGCGCRHGVLVADPALAGCAYRGVGIAALPGLVGAQSARCQRHAAGGGARLGGGPVLVGAAGQCLVTGRPLQRHHPDRAHCRHRIACQLCRLRLHGFAGDGLFLHSGADVRAR